MCRHISNIDITPDKIEQQLKFININKEAGPDSMPPYFIRQCTQNLILPLYLIFLRSLKDGLVPGLWKSVIKLVYKKKIGRI